MKEESDTFVSVNSSAERSTRRSSHIGQLHPESNDHSPEIFTISFFRIPIK